MDSAGFSDEVTVVVLIVGLTMPLWHPLLFGRGRRGGFRRVRAEALTLSIYLLAFWGAALALDALID